MNHLALLLSAYLALSGKPANLKGDTTELWDAFKMEYGKVYESSHVESMRRILFERNLAYISQHHRNIALFKQNNSEPSFSIGINHLADLSDVEYASMNGFKLSADRKESNLLQNSANSESFLRSILEDDSIEVPDELDWRKVEGRVSRVKDQGFCGSCWAFSSTGALEGQEKVRLDSLKSNKSSLIALSEQNLVDCVTKDNGCKGGIMADAFEFVRQEGGIDDEHSYPYESIKRQCRFQRRRSVMSDKGVAVLPEGDEKTLKEVVAKYGPVSVAIDASSRAFRHYNGGVFSLTKCNNYISNLDHAVLVVGYGSDSKLGDYWIVKNSWSKDWGENGYIRMARNKNNMCGVATVPMIPTF